MSQQLKCCNRPTTSIGGFDDAQLTDHAYNLSMCDFCGVIYKDDLWEDKGLRAWLLDGTVVPIMSDEEWAASGILSGVNTLHVDNLLGFLRKADLRRKNDPKSWGVCAIRCVWARIMKKDNRDVLLSMVEVDKVIEMAKGALYKDVFYDPTGDHEAELLSAICDEYIAELEAKLARKNKYMRP